MPKTLILHHECNLLENAEIIFFNDIIKIYFHKKNHNSQNNFETFRPYGISEKLLIEDAAYLDKIFDIYITKISIELNRIHNQEKSVRYWNIILGIWLRDFIYASYNRYKTLKEGLKKHKIDKAVLVEDNNSYTIKESTSFNKLTNNLTFDAIFVSNILRYIPCKSNFQIINYQISKTKKKDDFPKNKKDLLPKFISNFLSLFQRYDRCNFFVISSYLTLFEEIKLNFLLNKKIQYFYYPTIQYKKNEIDSNIRDQISFSSNSTNEFERILDKMIPIYLPLSVLENYNQIINFIEKLNLPKSPKKIFSSNCFGEGGPNQFWIADKVEQGSKYYIGQHGAGYLELYEKNFRVEIKPADGLISWGQDKLNKKIIPSFNFTIRNKKKRYSNNKNILLVFRSSGVRSVPYDRFAYGEIVFNNTEKLINNLDKKIKKNLVLRLHSNYKKGIYYNFDNFLNKNNSIKIDRKTNYIELAKKSKLTIFNDYSSGFLHNLILNIPSIVFMPLNLGFIHKDNKSDFEKLIENKLIFTDIHDLTNFLNKNIDNFETMWNEKNCIQSRKIFTESYSIPPPINKLDEFSKILKNLP